MAPRGRNCGCLGGPEGRISAPRACRVRCSPKGPKLGFEYLLTYKTLHCVCTACTAFPGSGILHPPHPNRRHALHGTCHMSPHPSFFLCCITLSMYKSTPAHLSLLGTSRLPLVGTGSRACTVRTIWGNYTGFTPQLDPLGKVLDNVICTKKTTSKWASHEFLAVRIESDCAQKNY